MEVPGWPPQGLGPPLRHLFVLALFCLIFPLFLTGAGAATGHTEFVCGSIDVRNSVQNFKKIENCTVIEGFLQILLIDNGTAKEYENLSFPKLREITGYLLLFRAAGMTSVGKIFPNLVVIRGGVLFHNFALVIYEMSSLKEIGLHNLTDILRGSVRIDKNGDLCYVSTIDWSLIARAGHEGNYIRNNRGRGQCPDTCHSSCPVSEGCPHREPWVGDRNCTLCWGPQKCQKVCKGCKEKATCLTEANGNGWKGCCAQECLGGCTGSTNRDCFVCRHFEFDDRCKGTCPEGTFKYMDRRCISEAECKNLSGKVITIDGERKVHLKPFNGSCFTECPAGYTENSLDPHRCQKCTGKCPKVCPAVLVNNVAAAQSLQGCTNISGSLDIRIDGGSNIIKELENNLKDIQEIKGYLKIAHSLPLVSLNFLKDLRVIRGEALDRGSYALLVLENQNLQDLWDWKKRAHPLEILNGTVFFHFNHKLCLSKINDLKNSEYARVANWDQHDVSEISNGDRMPCELQLLQIKILKQTNDAILISWGNFRNDVGLYDKRSLLGYVIYYREAPTQNVTIYDGRDACGADVWNVKDVDANPSANDTWMSHIIPQLKPFTQYALYVRAYMVASESKGAQSNIIFFKTNSSTPTAPLNMRAMSAQPNEIFINWSPPKQPNGIISNYTVVVTEKPDSPEFVFQRDYCLDDVAQNKPEFANTPATAVEYPVPNGTAPSPSAAGGTQAPGQFPQATVGPGGGECCSCVSDETKISLDKKQEDSAAQIQFEDFLHNVVYVKNPLAVTSDSRGRNRRNIYSTPDTDQGQSASSETPAADGSSTAATVFTETPPTDPKPSVVRVQNVSTEYLKVEGLKHFTEYAIEVKACQLVDPVPNVIMGCSLNAINTVRTLPLGGADDIPEESLRHRTENASIGVIHFMWDEPKEPNGLIVSYKIEYRKVSDSSKSMSWCISSQEYKENHGYRLSGLLPGNYTLRVRATSLARAGNWTRYLTFLVPAMPNESSLEVLWIIIPIILLCLLVIPVGGYYYFKKKFGIGGPDGILYASVNPEYMSAGLVYEPDEWEVPRESIAMLRELGQGSFGMVYEGEAKDIVIGKNAVKCAVKTVNESATLRERIEFLQEASVMKTFNCHHVVKLLGVVSKGHPTLVVMELMASGDLKSYLRSHRPDEVENEGRQPPLLKQILQMAIEIADGMAYLAAKKYVHRDLAARNCMVAEDLTVKIGDFGMTRDIYETDYYRKGGKGLLPVRWMAPESLKDGVFTSQSDVWSYGVVLWEMATLASQPYQGLSNEQVLKYVISGGIMEMPENCPEKLYALMRLCWQKTPRSRPTFSELIEVLLNDVSGNFREVSFYFTQRPQMMAAKEEEPPLEVVTSSTPLKSPSPRAIDCSSVTSREDSDDDELDSIRYFPNSTKFEGKVGNEQVQCVNGVHALEEGRASNQLDLNLGGSGGRRHVHSNSEGSKGMSLPSSDGSKGSKVSSVSNGSLANGHAAVPFASARTTTC